MSDTRHGTAFRAPRGVTKVFAIRPEPGLSKTIAAGAARALPISGVALSKVMPSGWTLPDLEAFDALLAGSANAFRHGGDKLSALTHLPVLAVGQATADAASDAGFTVARIGSGGLQQVLDGIDSDFQHLLRLSGEDHVPLSPPADVQITERIVYRIGKVDLSEEVASQLSKGALVLLHSAAAAQHFVNECNRLGVNRAHVSLCALGQRILEPVGEGWQAARAAANPTENDLLALAIAMCQD
uniref:uroporphyrinogen-III synthase n=1 Tax=uncultured Altererythrobacter sp. TaxID=500840 RepID=UPI00263854DB|nr:uroporphyrinogen-III synthase [uncultured Altererythrobacter sp.]